MDNKKIAQIELILRALDTMKYSHQKEVTEGLEKLIYILLTELVTPKEN